MAGLGLDPDAAAQPGDRSVHDRQTDTRTLKFLSSVNPLEHAKNAGMVLGSDTDTVILDGNRRPTGIARRSNGNERFFARASKFYRIVEQIGKHLCQYSSIAQDGRELALQADLS